MNALEKIVARKKQATTTTTAPTQANSPNAIGANGGLTPCPTCHSAIRWLNAAGTARCIGCHPPKIKALVRSREILVSTTAPGRLPDGTPIEAPVRRWETLVELPGGRLASATGIRELFAAGVLDPTTAASVGVSRGGENGRGGRAGGSGSDGEENQTHWVDVDPDEYFKSRAAMAERMAKSVMGPADPTGPKAPTPTRAASANSRR